jgi:hypothetical protein
MDCQVFSFRPPYGKRLAGDPGLDLSSLRQLDDVTTTPVVRVNQLGASGKAHRSTGGCSVRTAASGSGTTASHGEPSHYE